MSTAIVMSTFGNGELHFGRGNRSFEVCSKEFHIADVGLRARARGMQRREQLPVSPADIPASRDVECIAGDIHFPA